MKRKDPKVLTGNGYAARLAGVVALRRHVNGRLVRVARECGISAEMIPVIAQAMADSAWGVRPDPRARLVERHQRRLDDVASRVTAACLVALNVYGKRSAAA